MKPRKTTSTKRNRELAQIHIAKKDLGLDDETYRAILWDVARVNSASKLNDRERRAVLLRFKTKGWKNKSQRGEPRSVIAEKAPLIRKIGALLADMKLPWSYANGIAKQMYNIERLDWCRDDQLRGIIVASNQKAKKTVTQEVDINLLPPVLQELTDLIGLPATMKIVQWHRGTRLWVPALIETLAPDHKLVKLVGIDNARKMSGRYGGETLEIPKAVKAIRAVRDSEIRRQWPELSQRELALKYDMTERSIRKIIGKTIDNRQLSFEF